MLIQKIFHQKIGIKRNLDTIKYLDQHLCLNRIETYWGTFAIHKMLQIHKEIIFKNLFNASWLLEPVLKQT